MTTQTNTLKDYKERCEHGIRWENRCAVCDSRTLEQPEQEIDTSTTFDEVAKGLHVSRMAIATLNELTIEQRRSINGPLLKAQLFLKSTERAFKEALAQPSNEQVEPVAWANPNDLQNFDMKVRTNGGPLHTVPLYTHPPVPTAQTKEPASWTLKDVKDAWKSGYKAGLTTQPKEPEQEPVAWRWIPSDV